MLILTPNQTTADFLKKQQLEDTPKETTILPLEYWVQQQWELLIDGAHSNCFVRGKPLKVLTAIQTKAIWSRVIYQLNQNIEHLNHFQLVELASNGWTRLQQGKFNKREILKRLKAFENNQDKENSIQYSRWIERFEWLMVQNNYCTKEKQLELLADSIDVKSQKAIQLVGFSDENPIAEHSMQLLHAYSSKVSTSSELNASEQPIINVVELTNANAEQELSTAILWALEKHEENPKAVISIITPLLADNYSLIQRLTNQTQSEAIAIGGADKFINNASYNTMKLLLQWLVNGLNFNEVLQLVHSPYWIVQPNCELQAVIECLLFESNDENPFCNNNKPCSFSGFYKYVCNEIKGIEKGEDFLFVLEKGKQIKELSQKQSLTCWLNTFCEWLKQLNEDIEFKRYQKLIMNIQEQAAQLDSVISKCNINQAIQWLDQIARQPQPRQLKSKPIRIIDTIDGAIGSNAVWLCSADNQYWPSVVKSHPLIPFSLMREMEVPRSSAEWEIALCRHLFSQLEQSCQDITYSYRTDYNQPDLTISPLLEGRFTVEAINVKSIDAQRKILALEWVEDETVLPLKNHEKPAIEGGASLVKQAGECLFTAFVIYRLNAKPLINHGLGISPLQQGNFLHKVMELIWGELKDAAALKALSDEQLWERCNTVVSKVLDKVATKTSIEPLQLEVEQQRMVNMVYEWLLNEKQRPPFHVIATEQKVNIEIAGISLQLRVDRIDVNAGKKYLIIDYKTTKNLSSKLWAVGENRKVDLESLVPPPEPQLPLYALIANNSQGIAIVQINSTKQKIIGLCDKNSWEQHQLKAVEWDRYRKYWKNSIENTLTHYVNGNIEMKKRPPATLDVWTPLHRNLE